MSRAADLGAIDAALGTMSDDDVRAVRRLLALGAPSALAASGPAPVYDLRPESVSGPAPTGVVVLDPRPDPQGIKAAIVLAAWHAMGVR